MTAIRRPSLLPNFRRASGLKNVYRSSSPDNVAELIGSRNLLEPERFILYDATLIVDLRSLTEVDLGKHKAIIEGAPGGQFEEVDGPEAILKSQAKRQLLILTGSCAPSREDFLQYVRNEWVTPDDLLRINKMSEEKQKDFLYQVVNKYGLPGLVEMILGCKLFICTVLKSITAHLERNRHGKVLIHCTLGKDRCGIIAMLCESMLGVRDDEIIDDFAKSRCIRTLAESKITELFQGRVDSVRFSDAPPETMISTLKYLRDKYGSVAEYLDSAGFDLSWRQRFVRLAS